MLILAIDCCGSSSSVGVWQDECLLAHLQERMERGQDARLMPMIVDAMAQAKIGFPALDRIAVTRGPGSFTGTRVGLAAARGIGIASGKPVIGIDRFAIYKAMHPKAEEKNLLVVINSKRAELFCKFFPAMGEAGDPMMLTKEEIDAFLAQHPGTDVAGDREEPEDQRILAACAALAAEAAPQDPAFLPNPLYIRPPDVTIAIKS